MQRIKKYRYQIIIALMLVAIVALAIAYFTRAPSQSETISSVSKHIMLPNGKPVIAEVTDVDKLQSSLKAICQKGDYILIYSDAQKVIVYRPSLDKIVEVQPLLIGTKPNPNLNSTVVIYNGSGTEAKLDAFVKNLYTVYPNVRLTVKDNAPRTFPKTVVFTKEPESPLSKQVAEALKIEAGIVPEGISDKNADITFIVGEN